MMKEKMKITMKTMEFLGYKEENNNMRDDDFSIFKKEKIEYVEKEPKFSNEKVNVLLVAAIGVGVIFAIAALMFIAVA